MPTIYDNIDQRPLPALSSALTFSGKSDFCVGYFNLRGWRQIDSLIERWDGGPGKQCRLLVGMLMTTLMRNGRDRRSGKPVNVPREERTFHKLSASLCLYGSDIDESTTPVEASLEWAIQKVRRRGGARAGNFPGSDVLLDQLERGASRRRVGLKPRERTPVRGGALLYVDTLTSQSVGSVTSGTFGPSAVGPVAMGYVPNALAGSALSPTASRRSNG